MADEAKPEVLRPYTQEFSEAVQAGIKSGDLAIEDNSVTAKIEKLQADGSMPKIDFQKAYKKLVAKTTQGALILAGERTEKGQDNAATLLQMVTDAFDSGVRSNVRAQIVSDAQGPEAALKKAALAMQKVTGQKLDDILTFLRGNPAVIAALSGANQTQTETPAEAPATA